MKTLKALFLLTLCLLSAHSKASLITIDESRMDAIFSQPSFGDNPIDIRILEPYQLVRPDLLDLTTSAELWGLFGLHMGPSYIANMFFVNNINYCSGYDPIVIGCGEMYGNDAVVEYGWADYIHAAELISHELGHNLGLSHRDSRENLMNSYLGGGSDLNDFEVATVFNSPLVQWDNSGFFIEILPVLVLAQAIPVTEPGSLILGLAGLAGFTAGRIRRA